MGMSKSYIKNVFMDHWDDYQLKSVSSEFGGNRPFFDLMKEYNFAGLPINDKYKKPVTKYYYKKHLALLEGKKFEELPPAKDWSETF
jgi:hypothetical protein